MDVRIVRDLKDQQDYVLLPIQTYHQCREAIERSQRQNLSGSYEDMVTPEQAISNPVMLMRLRAGYKQKDLAEQLNVSQAYVSKIEAGDKVSDRVLANVRAAIQALAVRNAG